MSEEELISYTPIQPGTCWANIKADGGVQQVMVLGVWTILVSDGKDYDDEQKHHHIEAVYGIQETPRSPRVRPLRDEEFLGFYIIERQ